MDLMCTPKLAVSMLATCYFLGQAAGGLLTFPMPDRIGRWKTHAIFGTGSLFAQLTLLLAPLYWVRLPAMALLGSMMIKNSLAYIWGFEITHSTHKSFASSVINLVDFSNAAVAGIFFLYVDRDWYPLYSTWVGMSVAAYLALLLFCVESPKWLLMQGNTRGAIKSLNYIAWFNGSAYRVPDGTTFVESALSRGEEGRRPQPVFASLSSQLNFSEITVTGPDGEMKTVSKETQMFEFVVISCLYAMCYMQYGLAYLTLAHRGGNMFVNGILLSVAEAASAAITGWALVDWGVADTSVFRVCAILSITSNLAYFALGGAGAEWARYTTLFISYLGQAGCFNCVFAVMELRFPPRSMGSAIAVSMQFFAPLLCSANPLVASADSPFPLFWMVALASTQFVWTFLLPPPGQYMPSADSLRGDDGAGAEGLDGKMLPYEARNSHIDAPLHHEKVHNVVRPTRLASQASFVEA